MDMQLGKKVSLQVSIVILVVLSLVFQSNHAKAVGENLISNPSLELDTNEGVTPQGWQTNTWGDNTAEFTYPVPGSDGTSGAEVSISAYSSGDAKWYFNNVPVEAGEQYIFQNDSKSTAPTELIVRYTNSSEELSYELIGTVEASTGWQHNIATFTPPAGTVFATVFHVLAQTGSLTVDNFNLTKNSTTPPPSTGNLIINPSAEIPSTNLANSPEGWQTNTWGENTAVFTYENNGFTGNKSVKTTVSNYVSGDAKWSTNPVTIQPNTTYTFINHYKSDVPTHAVLVTFDTNDQPSYSDLNIEVPASPDTWASTFYTFTTPGDAQKLTVYHVLEQNGWLQVDDISLSTNTNTPPLPALNLVPNGSLEEADATNPAQPALWHGENWGINTPLYEYVQEGHTGSRSIKLTVSGYTSGDANWGYQPQPLETGKDYHFSAWYKTNTIPRVVAQYIHQDNSESFYGLSNPEPDNSSTTNWQHYTGVFPVPTGIKSVSVFFYLSNNGWVQTDDYEVTPYQYPSFDRGLVTLTFDDGFETNITNVLPVLNNYGFGSTQCYATQYIEGFPEHIANIQTFANNGHEICSHTVTHPLLTSLTPAQIETELTQSKNFLSNITGQTITSFSSPHGDYNAGVNEQIANHYQAHRTTDEGYNAKDSLDTYRLKVQNMKSTTTLAQFQEWVTKAQTDKTWLILLYHKVGNESIGEFDTFKSDFDAQMAWLASSGVTVKRMDDALSEIQSQ